MSKNRLELQIQRNEIEQQIDSLEKELFECQEQKQTLILGNTKASIILLEEDLSHEIDALKSQLTSIDAELAKLKKFNREVCLQNIDYLLSKNSIKLGVLESESGNRPGYLSRMRSGKSASDPSIEFLMVASEQLNIPLDILVAANISDLTPTEVFILDFLNKIIQDTEKDLLFWEHESVAELQSLEIFTDDYGNLSVSHPLFSVHKQAYIDDYTYSFYESRFFRKSHIEPCNKCYHAQLIPTDQWLYIMECTEIELEKKVKTEPFFEFYMVDFDRFGNSTPKKICNSRDVSSPIKAAINSLVMQISWSTSHLHIEDNVKDAITAYMKGAAPLPSDDDDLPFC